MPPEQPFLAEHPHSPSTENEQVLKRESEARQLCQIGDYHVILNTFERPEHQDLLKEQTRRLQSDPTLQQELVDIKKVLTPAHWEMLTLIELFDKETFYHCIRTYQNVYRKLATSSPIGNYLRARLDTEQVSKETLCIAALLHDVGKIGLPLKDIVLNNTLTDQEWQTHYLQFLCEHNQCSKEEAEKQARETLKAGTASNLRAKDLVPFVRCLTPEQCRTLEQSHIDPNHTLGQIINVHQDFSGAIARHYQQDEIFITLVSNHHERKLSPNEPFPVATSAIRIATIIRIADVLDALHSDRAYKKGNPFLTTLSILIHQAQDGFIDTELARLWIADDMQVFERSEEQYFEVLPSAVDQEHADEADYTPITREAIIRKEHFSLEIINSFLHNHAE